MWNSLAKFILKFRLFLIIGLLAFTGFMGYQAKYIQWSYDLLQIVPDDDPDLIAFKEFRQLFGEDANVLAIGISDSTVYSLKGFNRIKELTNDLENLEGIKTVASLGNVVTLVPNTVEKRFEALPVLEGKAQNKQQLDSALNYIRTLKFYDGKLVNSKNGATLILISMQADYLNSSKRIEVMNNILALTEGFSADTNIDAHFAGLPYVRSILVQKVRKELNMFLLLSVGISALILFIFFRSFSPVIFPLFVIGMVIVWTMGTLSLLQYKITMLTGLLPSIMVVIGIPNCIYLLNKYHREFSHSNDKFEALKYVVRKIGIVTLITNTTTAIGFFVLVFTGIAPLQEFGIVASINIMGTFIISILLIPAAFSYLPSPKHRNTRHLDFKPVNNIIKSFIYLVSNHRAIIYSIVAVLSAAALYGAYQVKTLTYMVDDLPEESSIKQDLAFFEKNFRGIMPLEILINTGRKKGYRKTQNLETLDALENYLSEFKEITPPVSFVSFLKAANQAYFNDSLDYRLPSRREAGFIRSYLRQQNDTANLAGAFVDTTGQYLRVSMKVADLGSIEINNLLENKLRPGIDSILADSDLDAYITGTTLIFIKGNQYLVENLLQSMLLAYALIALIMGFLFRDVRIVLISLIPNTIPLLFTAGLMGYFGVPLKPSTVLVFSIAFGISVDDSIHFLAKYRQELYAYNFDVKKAVLFSMRETGQSMIYTSIVLFCGFIIFVGSTFGGTVALGALTSTTLFIAMLTNLILLPALLLTFGFNHRKVRIEPVLDQYEEFYLEEEDEEINHDMIELNRPKNNND